LGIWFAIAFKAGLLCVGVWGLWRFFRAAKGTGTWGGVVAQARRNVSPGKFWYLVACAVVPMVAFAALLVYVIVLTITRTLN
jgi:hypothetical protein